MEARASNFELGKITAVFDTKDKAENVFDALRSRGYESSDIDLVMTDETRSRFYGSTSEETRSDMGDKAMEGAGIGSAIGGTIGAIVGAIAAIGTSLVLPGIGLVVAGPIAAALAGAGAGGLTGGLLGALVGSGIPEEHAKEFEGRISEGGTAIAIRPRSVEDANYIRDLFQRNSNGQVYDEHYQSDENRSNWRESYQQGSEAGSTYDGSGGINTGGGSDMHNMPSGGTGGGLSNVNPGIRTGEGSTY